MFDLFVLFFGDYILEVIVNGCFVVFYYFMILVISDIEIVQFGLDILIICLGESIILIFIGIVESLAWIEVGSDVVLFMVDFVMVILIDGAIYQVEGVSLNGCIGMDYVVFWIVLFFILFVLFGGIFCFGEVVFLFVDQGISWSWSIGDIIQQIFVSFFGNIIYIVIVMDDNGCSIVLLVNVVVVFGNGFFVFQDQEFCVGESVMFGVSGGESFFWSIGDMINSIIVIFDIIQIYIVI